MRYHLLFGMLVTLGCSSKTETQNQGSGGSSTGGSASGSAGMGTSSGGVTTGGSSMTASGGSTAGTTGGATSGGKDSGGAGATTSQGGGSPNGGSATGGSPNGGAATGGARATGGSTTGGSSGAGNQTTGGSGGAVSSGESVLQRNKDATRAGHFVQPTLTKAKAAMMMKETGFEPKFGGTQKVMWASPVYIQDGPGGKGAVFAVTNGDDVYAYDETTGAELWHKSIGTPASKTGVSCGDSVQTLGIMSTPAIDASTRTIYVAGAVGDASGILRHEIHALSVDDGTERPNWPVDATKVKSGSYTFNTKAQNQRGALSLVNGILYVPYGGHVGDCDNYRGWVVAVDTKDPSKIGAWASAAQSGAGIWAPGGMASDGTSIFAATGNTNAPRAATHQDSEQIVRLTGLATFSGDAKDYWYPSNWSALDSADEDIGGGNTVYLTVPGATPQNYVVVVTKNGELIMRDAANLGGMSGSSQAEFKVTSKSGGPGGNLHTIPTVYNTPSGVFMAFSVEKNVVCPSGSTAGTGPVIMGVRIGAGSPAKPEVAWCAPLGSPTTSPISTTTDGSKDPLVWYVNAGKLSALDGLTGANAYTSTETCATTRRWTSPIAIKGRIIVPADGHLCAWSAP